MRYWYDKRIKGIVCEPNSAEGWCRYILDIGIDYDGCKSAKDLMSLVDEFMDMASKAIDCIYAGQYTDTTPSVMKDTKESFYQAEKERSKDI